MTQHPLTIAILGGTGHLGPGLALRWAYAGHHVLIGSRQAEKAQGMAAELNAELGRESIRGLENAEAARQADICVLAVVQDAHQAALEAVKEALAGKILVDTTARLSFPDLTPPAAPAAAQLAQQLLGEQVRVVAAFQTVSAASLRENFDQPLDSDVLVCSDDSQAAGQIMELASDAGLQGYYAGGLNHAIVLEGITSLLVSINKQYKSRHGTLRVAGVDPHK